MGTYFLFGGGGASGQRRKGQEFANKYLNKLFFEFNAIRMCLRGRTTPEKWGGVGGGVWVEG